MTDFGAELGITDSLHELELWRHRLKRWELTLPWPEGAGALLRAESLLELGEATIYLCRLIRQRLGFDEGLAAAARKWGTLKKMERALGVHIWKMEREERRLVNALPAEAPTPPRGLPRARLGLGR